jgi:hypothetical protein
MKRVAALGAIINPASAGEKYNRLGVGPTNVWGVVRMGVEQTLVSLNSNYRITGSVVPLYDGNGSSMQLR